MRARHVAYDAAMTTVVWILLFGIRARVKGIIARIAASIKNIRLFKVRPL